MSAVVYGKTNCSYCDKAIKLLNYNKIEYQYLDIHRGDGILDQLRGLLPAVKTVPQIWVDDVYVGGYDDLVAYLTASDDHDYGQGQL